MEEIKKITEGISSPTLEEGGKIFDEIFNDLPQVNISRGNLGQFKGIWFNANMFRYVMFVRKHFEAKDKDIILATVPKSGTTWLKALTSAIINRGNHSMDQSPLLSSNPHALIPFLENMVNLQENCVNCNVVTVSPRIFSTHIPYQCLPESVLRSKSKIIYLCRNPMDVFASTMAFASENKLVKLAPLEDEFRSFCDGFQSFGPFWDHILGYWKQSLKTDDDPKVLFLRYEDLKKDINSAVKKIAGFLGFPISDEEDANGVVEDIARLCSFENLKNLEVNKKGETQTTVVKVKNNSFFRKGEVGDWRNTLTPSMAEEIEKIMEEKFAGSGLALEIHSV